MIYTPLTCWALQIACTAHTTQLDKAGLPYIHHPLHLAEQMADEVSTCVALLHDVLEDTGMDAGDLRTTGFPDEVVNAISSLTRREGETYKDYIQRLAHDPIARKVKIADLEHNSDTSRLCCLPDDERKPIERLIKTRYRKALEFLRSYDQQETC